MHIKSKIKGKYRIITISDEFKVITDLTKLKSEIEKLLELGDKNIAVNFSDASYLYSGAISVLISCYRLLKENGGNLCIIEPQQRVLELLVQMNIDSFIDIFHTEEDLLNQTVA